MLQMVGGAVLLAGTEGTSSLVCKLQVPAPAQSAMFTVTGSLAKTYTQLPAV